VSSGNLRHRSKLIHAAILSYLTRHYDPDHKFSFSDPLDISRAEQWMAWQHGGLGPMQGQANHFNVCYGRLYR
jgi:glutathione S-transferase